MGHLHLFLTFCESNNILPEDGNKMYFLKWLDGQSESTIKQRIGTLQNFYTYVLDMPYVASGLPYPIHHDKPPEYLTIQEVKNLLGTIKNAKQNLILTLQYSLALRVGEVVILKGNNFYLCFHPEQKIHYYQVRVYGKGGKYRILPVPNETINKIKMVLGNDIIGRDEYLFKGQTKEAYSIRSVQIIFHRAKSLAGINKDGCTHLLRHSMATHHIQAGRSLRYVQELLGHSSSKTTERYTHLNTNDLMTEFNKTFDGFKEQENILLSGQNLLSV
jgi:site-specific recombinase XerD